MRSWTWGKLAVAAGVLVVTVFAVGVAQTDTNPLTPSPKEIEEMRKNGPWRGDPNAQPHPTGSALITPPPHMPPQTSQRIEPGAGLAFAGSSMFHVTSGWGQGIGWTEYTVIGGQEPTDAKHGLLVVYAANWKTAEQTKHDYPTPFATGPVVIDAEADGIVHFHTTGGTTGTFNLLTGQYGP